MPREAEFTIPKDGEIFISMILQRCEHLIGSGIWHGISSNRLDTWFNNFKTNDERYFAACLLDALIYRSEEQTVALMKHLFQKVLPDFGRAHAAKWSLPDDWMGAFRATALSRDPRIRIVPVIRWRDPPTKSGPLLARLYRRHLGFNDAWMIWPWQIDHCKGRGVSAFLFIDDFMGTGEQFLKFAKQFAIMQRLNGVFAAYAPLVAHEDGVKAVESEMPDVHTCAVEVLNSKYDLFADNSVWFRDVGETNSPQSARSFYERLIRSRSLPIPPKYSTGHGKLAIAYAFRHATPNNCLPVFWIRNSNWKSLLER